MREAARAAGRARLYDGRWRDRDPSEAPAGVKPVIRLKAPLTGETVIEDQVQGRVVWQNQDLDDLVLLRSDGNPTYMLAVVVDDHDMGVTHIIRGDDHLTNAARQKQIYEALGWPVPVMAHIPLIHGPDGSKLSKRHGALGVDAYRALGYLPEALRNYLVRLGWSHGDQEIFSTQEMIDLFDLPQIGRSAARFDFVKLESLNGHYMRHMADAALLAALERALPYHRGRGRAFGQARRSAARKAAEGDAGLEGARQDTGRTARPVALHLVRSAAADGRQGAGAPDRPKRARCCARCSRISRRSRTGRRKTPKRRCAPLPSSANVKLGSVAQPLRAALTGRVTSPGIFDVLTVLGKTESLARIREQAMNSGSVAA